MLKFYQVAENRDSELFKGRIRGSEYPSSPWSNIVIHFNPNHDIQTKIVSGTRVPKIGFEYKGKSFSITINSKTSSRDIIKWAEKLLSMYSDKKIEEPVLSKSNAKSETTPLPRPETDKTMINAIAGGSMVIALAGFVGAAIGSVISQEESKYENTDNDFLLLDDDGNPVDFANRMKNDPEKFL